MIGGFFFAFRDFRSRRLAIPRPGMPRTWLFIFGRMAGYSKDVIEQLKAQANIADIVQQFVPLKATSGGRFLGLCPFHDDRKPSMNVVPALGIYKCFACGAAGDVFKFVMEHEKMDFRSAVEFVASSSGFVLPKEASREEPQKLEERELVLELNRLAASWFEAELARSDLAKSYLAGRGITAETVQKFRLGYAPDAPEGLLKFAAKNGFTAEQLVTAGLAKAHEYGGATDKFRGRLMIPIMNLSGTVVAFGGRLLEDREHAPKYMNSPETALYSKGNTLFGLHQAKQDIIKAGNVIIVEGYFDLISLYQAGIRNVVAASGTALTEMHAATLSRYAKTAYLVFDGDAAGQKATRRSLEIVLAKAITPKIFELSRPNGEKIDPDNFIRERGPEAFLAELATAETWLDYLGRKLPHETPEERAELVQEAKTVIAGIENKELANQYLHLVAERYSTAANLRGIKLKTKSHTAESAPAPKMAFVPAHEKRYLNLVLRNRRVLEAAAKVFDLTFVSQVNLFQSGEVSDILGLAFAHFEETGKLDLKLFMESLSEAEQELVLSLGEETWEETAADKEFLEMTLNLEKQFVRRLAQETRAYEHIMVEKEIDKIIALSRQARIQPNEAMQNILSFREKLVEISNPQKL